MFYGKVAEYLRVTSETPIDLDQWDATVSNFDKFRSIDFQKAKMFGINGRRPFGDVVFPFLDNEWSVYPQTVDGDLERNNGKVIGGSRQTGRFPGKNKDGSTLKWGEFREKPLNSTNNGVTFRKNGDRYMEGIRNRNYNLNSALALGPASGDVFVIDMDIEDEEASADIQKLFFEICGDTDLQRIGLAPKIALFYKQDPNDPIGKKITIRFEEKKYKGREIKDWCSDEIEVLTNGTITLTGQHHSTGQGFEWPFKDPAQVHSKDVPILSKTTLDKFIVELNKLRELKKQGSYSGNSQPIKFSYNDRSKIYTPRVPDNADNIDSKWKVDGDGYVTDGREAYLFSLAYRIATSNKDASPEGLADIVFEQFHINTIDDRKWSDNKIKNDALDKIKYAQGKVRSGEWKEWNPSDFKADENGNFVKEVEWNKETPENLEAFGSLEKRPEFLTPVKMKFTQEKHNLNTSLDISGNFDAIAKANVNALNDFKQRVYDEDANKNVVIVLKTQPGAGKTTSVILDLAKDKRTYEDYTIISGGKEVNGNNPYLFHSPRHNNMEQNKETLTMASLDPALDDKKLAEKAVEAGVCSHEEFPNMVDQIRRNAIDKNMDNVVYKGKDKSGCKQWDKVKKLEEAGLSSANLCYKKGDENNEDKYCPHHAECPWILQKEAAKHTNFNFAPTALLGIKKQIDAHKNARAVIIDENCSDIFLPCEEVHIDTLEANRSIPSQTASEREEGIDPITHVFARDEGVERAVLNGIKKGIDPCIALLKGYRKDKIEGKSESQSLINYTPTSTTSHHEIDIEDVIAGNEWVKQVAKWRKDPFPWGNTEDSQEQRTPLSGEEDLNPFDKDEDLNDLEDWQLDQLEMWGMEVVDGAVRRIVEEAPVPTEEAPVSHEEAPDSLYEQGFYNEKNPPVWTEEEGADVLEILHSWRRAVDGSGVKSFSLDPDSTQEDVDEVANAPRGKEVKEEKFLVDVIISRLENMLDGTAKGITDDRLKFLCDSDNDRIMVSDRTEFPFKGVPVLILDSSFSEEIMGPILGSETEIIIHGAETVDNRKVDLIADRTNSTSSNVARKGERLKVQESCAIKMGESKTITEKLSRSYPNERILEISTKKVRVARGTGYISPPNVDSAHNGNLRGDDDFKEHTVSHIIGKTNLPYYVVDAKAGALGYDSDKKSYAFDKYGTGLTKDGDALYLPKVEMPINMRDGSVRRIETSRYPTELVFHQAIQDQSGAEDTLQAMGRLRTVYHKGAPKIVYVSTTSIPENVIVDAIMHTNDFNEDKGIISSYVKCGGIIGARAFVYYDPDNNSSIRSANKDIQWAGFGNTEEDIRNRQAEGWVHRRVQRVKLGKVVKGSPEYVYVPGSIEDHDEFIKEKYAFMDPGMTHNVWAEGEAPKRVRNRAKKKKDDKVDIALGTDEDKELLEESLRILTIESIKSGDYERASKPKDSDGLWLGLAEYTSKNRVKIILEDGKEEKEERLTFNDIKEIHRQKHYNKTRDLEDGIIEDDIAYESEERQTKVAKVKLAMETEESRKAEEIPFLEPPLKPDIAIPY